MSPLLKHCPEFTCERCERFQRATLDLCLCARRSGDADAAAQERMDAWLVAFRAELEAAATSDEGKEALANHLQVTA